MSKRADTCGKNIYNVEFNEAENIFNPSNNNSTDIDSKKIKYYNVCSTKNNISIQIDVQMEQVKETIKRINDK